MWDSGDAVHARVHACVHERERVVRERLKSLCFIGSSASATVNSGQPLFALSFEFTPPLALLRWEIGGVRKRQRSQQLVNRWTEGTRGGEDVVEEQAGIGGSR